MGPGGLNVCLNRGVGHICAAGSMNLDKELPCDDPLQLPCDDGTAGKAPDS